MEITYSPHREAGGALHLPSPTLAHKYSIEGFDSISKLRKSLSRSPSRPQRFQLFTTATPHRSPASPLAPFGASQKQSPALSQSSDEGQAPVSPIEAHHQASSSRKAKFNLRRTAPARSSPRNRSASNSPMRRVLGDATNQGNSLPHWSNSMQDDHTRPESSDYKENSSRTDSKPHHFRMSLNDGPIKFEFGRSAYDLTTPVKSSPLKRSDGVLNLEQGGFGSPVAKRRSLHGAPSGADMESLKLMFAGDGACDDADDSSKENNDRPIFGSPYAARDSPLRKTVSLRKSTLQQRQTPNQPKSQASEFAVPGLAASKTRQRFSLDGSSTIGTPVQDSSFRRSMPGQSGSLFSQYKAIPHRPSPASKQPHPLATALSPSSSASSLCEDSQQSTVPPLRDFAPSTAIKPSGFSKSLPVGATRPSLTRSSGGTFINPAIGQGPEFATPDGYRSARPLPAAFMSTGLISKKNRNTDNLAGEAQISYAMPDTPSKRASFPPDTTSPFRRSTFSIAGGASHDFGSPSTPFSAHERKISAENFGNSISAFNVRMKPALTRRESFVSIDGDELGQSPTHMVDSQSSVDEFPPTPTKPIGEGRRSKENSLRSSMFGRGENRRTSISQDTFVPPSALDVSLAPLVRKTTPTGFRTGSSQTSPHTPQDTFHPPDPSGLSISGHGPSINPFKLSTASNTSFPPATPTTARDYKFPFGNPRNIQVAGVTKNDVDTSLTARFATVSLYGQGEFSQVYRVEAPTSNSFDLGHSFSNFGKAWAVKKTRRPYAGSRERERKQVEVRILSALRGNEHVVNFVESWEDKGHLYIQTDFCENGNLKDFLTNTGFKGRLDDFRIWKIFLELSMGVKHIHNSGFIHLDLKPANVFIDWEGVLKIGDFGLASPWPAPKNIEGEGDREYIAPEVLSGFYDKPADIFALGMIMLETAGNLILPDNGTSWQRLRTGDMSDIPSLTFSSESSLPRDDSGDPLSGLPNDSHETLCGSDGEDSFHKFVREGSPTPMRTEDCTKPPTFMVDVDDREALDKVVQWLISPNHELRPTVEEVLDLDAVRWVDQRRRAGATVFEGNYGPADDVLNHDRDIDMTDVN